MEKWVLLVRRKHTDEDVMELTPLGGFFPRDLPACC